MTLGLNGRLGNQMFQYAAVLALAKLLNYDYCIPDVPPSEDPTRRFELDKGFNITAKKTDDFTFVEHRYTENIIQPDPLLWKNRDVPDNIDLFGYFQSEECFKNIKGLIRTEFQFKDDIYEEANNLYTSLIGKNEEGISVHVRRTDYVNNEHNHPLQGDDYYIPALKKFEANYNKFLIVSDDIDWCRQYSPFQSEKFIFIENTNHFVDMCLMTLCTHNIISNSSFSWWGAWLNPNPNKIVVAPKTWFGPSLINKNPNFHLPPSWILI
tara:strand:+ start:262 stop:1062 length:801 start_codon:yes stop_codon:yes gene_type:complete